VILLDEPTTGVDPVSRREFWKLLSEFLANGITIVMSTPYLDEAERCTRVALVHEGRVLAADEPARLRRLIPGRMLEVVAHGASAAESLRALPCVHDAQVFGERVHITLDDDSPACEERFRSALRATPLADVPVRPLQPSLEDVFIARLSAGPPSPSRDSGETGPPSSGGFGGRGRENLNA
jgi:ABC-2 type transport system ATP-binding protein